MHIVTFSVLADFPGLLEAHLRAFPEPTANGDADLNMADLRQLLVDILAYESDVFHANLTRALHTDRPIFDLKPDTAWPEAGSDNRTLAELTEVFHSARKRTLSILGDLTEAQWTRAGVLGEAEINLIGWVHHLCAHDWDHLAHLQRRLAACSAP